MRIFRELKSIGKRSFFYIGQGYAVAALPFAFLGYASSIYYLAIGNLPDLNNLFPTFSSFLILAAITLPAMCCLVGYVYMKKSWLYRISQVVTVESNPYQNTLIAPINIPIWEGYVKLFKKFEIDTEELEEIIERSKNFAG